MPTAREKSRGYYKIEGAARAFNFDFRGKTVLDIGSSTGGFTQYALDHGATKVIAVEKGTNQMEKPLRFDPRVDLHEKTDIFDVTTKAKPRGAFATTGAIDEAPPVTTGGREEATRGFVFVMSVDVILADVSFVSLTKVLKYAKMHLARSDTDFLVMLKPQFEANPAQLNHGVVKNDKIRREIIRHFEQWLKAHGFIIMSKHDNDLRGKTGNQERFYYLKLAK